MIAIMCDALELGRFERDANNILRLKLHDGVNKSWLPYIFEIGLNDDMDKIIKIWKKDRVRSESTSTFHTFQPHPRE